MRCSCYVPEVDRAENFVAIGVNAGYRHFHLYSEGFQKAFFTELLNQGVVWFTLFNTIRTLNDLEEGVFEKIVEKGENAANQAKTLLFGKVRIKA